jgi:hypothetical protein
MSREFWTLISFVTLGGLSAAKSKLFTAEDVQIPEEMIPLA